MRNGRGFLRRVQRYAVQVLESLAHCAPDCVYTGEVVVERFSHRCPDYIPDWLMDSGATA